jgi:hypothetical protein
MGWSKEKDECIRAARKFVETRFDKNRLIRESEFLYSSLFQKEIERG